MRLINNIFIDESNVPHRHQVFQSADIQGNCFIADKDAPDVRSCPNCSRVVPVDDEWQEVFDDE